MPSDKQQEALSEETCEALWRKARLEGWSYKRYHREYRRMLSEKTCPGDFERLKIGIPTMRTLADLKDGTRKIT